MFLRPVIGPLEDFFICTRSSVSSPSFRMYNRLGPLVRSFLVGLGSTGPSRLLSLLVGCVLGVSEISSNEMSALFFSSSSLFSFSDTLLLNL